MNPQTKTRSHHELQTVQDAKAAVAGGYALLYIPMALRTAEVCRVAVARHGGALAHVPGPLRSPALCRVALADFGDALRYLDRAQRTPELCLIAVQEFHRAIKEVPLDRRALVLAARAMSPRLLGAAQPGDTLYMALERLQPGLGEHHAMLCAIGVEDPAANASLLAFLDQTGQPARTELPDLVAPG